MRKETCGARLTGWTTFTHCAYCAVLLWWYLKRRYHVPSTLPASRQCVGRLCVDMYGVVQAAKYQLVFELRFGITKTY